MYLLSETAIGDSKNYEVLSLEEVEELKKEHNFLSGRLDASKRKLALEMKLRDAAKSLSRLHSPKSPRASQEFDVNDPSKSRRSRLSFFGRNDKSDDELAVANRKCEDLAHEVWKLERRTQTVEKRLLEHTAGILQMTHKGLKKNPKNNFPRTPESIHSGNARGSVDGFDDRSLYKTLDNLDGFGGSGRRGLGGQASEPMSVSLDAIQNTERKLEMLSGRLRDLALQSNPHGEFEPVPQASGDGGPVNPIATVDAHLAYIENNLGMIASPVDTGAARTVEPNYELEQQVSEMSARIHNLMVQTGLSRSPTIPPPDPSHAGLEDQLSYLSSSIDGLQIRVDSLLDQKGILTTQIQQQRELNSKSDAERDAHVGGLIEQLAHVKKDLELSERENENMREQLNITLEQLETVRGDLAGHEEGRSKDDPAGLASEKEARERAEQDILRLESQLEQFHSQTNTRAEEADTARSHAEGEVARLEVTIQQLRREADSRAEEATQARDRAEKQVFELETAMEQLRTESDARLKEANDMHAQSGADVPRLEAEIVQLRSDMEAQLQETTEARERAERQVTELEAAMEQLRTESDARLKEANEMHAQSGNDVPRLEAEMMQLRSDMEAQLKEAAEAQTRAEEEAARMKTEMAELESEVVKSQTELTMVKAELDGAYGSRAQRAAEVASNPAIQKEIDDLNTRNIEMAEELAILKAGPGDNDLQKRVQILEKELRETTDDYEAMTKASIEFEKERERFEGFIDELRERCEQLETQISEERINSMGGVNSPTSVGRDGTSETTSTMVLKNEFKKMMRDTRIENMKILKVSDALVQVHRRMLMNDTGGTRRASKTRRRAPCFEKGAWKVESRCHDFMITIDLDHCFY